jgi:hypothetical protein
MKPNSYGGRNGDESEARDFPNEEPALDPIVQEAIGKALKAHFQDLMQAPLPDRLVVLLAELQAKENEQPAGQGH